MNTNSNTGGKLAVNVSKLDRLASIVAGSLLIYKGLKDQDAPTSIPMIAGGGYMLFRGATGHCVAYSALGKNKLPDTVKNINIITKFTVNRPRHDVYNFWRQLSNLPLFMEHLQTVDVIDTVKSHWVAKIPGGLGKIEWDAEIVKEIEGELLGWNSLPHATINNAGKVEFRDANDGQGTELTVIITYRAPFGDIGEGIAGMLTPVAKKIIEKDIKNFKRYIEAGDIPGVK